MIQSRYFRAQQIASGMAVLAGGVGLAGWFFSVTALMRIAPGLITMKVNTAVGLLGLGLALFLLPHGVRGAIRLLGGMVTLLGLVTMVEFIFGLDLGIDNTFYAAVPESFTAYPGRMSFVTALLFGILGAGVLLATARSRKAHRWSGRCALVAVVISAITLLGFAGPLARLLVSTPGWGTLALHTTLGMAFASLALLWLRPDQTSGWGLLSAGGLAGVEARRFIFVVLPALVLLLALSTAILVPLGAGADLAGVIRNILLLLAAIWAIGRTLRNLAEAQEGLAEEVRIRTAELQLALGAAELGLLQMDVGAGRVTIDAGLNRMIGGKFLVDAPFFTREWNALIHPDDLPAAEQKLREHLNDATHPFEVRYRFRVGEGEWRWLEVKGRALLESPGASVRRVVAIVSDITRRRALEADFADRDVPTPGRPRAE